MRKTAYSVGLVGATGLIGEKFLRTLEKRNFPVGELRLFASEKSAGKDTESTIEVLDDL